MEKTYIDVLTKLARANINILRVTDKYIHFEFQWRDPRSHAARWSKQVYRRDADVLSFIKELEAIYEIVQQSREALEG